MSAGMDADWDAVDPEAEQGEGGFVECMAEVQQLLVQNALEVAGMTPAQLRGCMHQVQEEIGEQRACNPWIGVLEDQQGLLDGAQEGLLNVCILGQHVHSCSTCAFLVSVCFALLQPVRCAL